MAQAEASGHELTLCGLRCMYELSDAYVQFSRRVIDSSAHTLDPIRPFPFGSFARVARPNDPIEVKGPICGVTAFFFFIETALSNVDH